MRNELFSPVERTRISPRMKTWRSSKLARTANGRSVRWRRRNCSTITPFARPAIRFLWPSAIQWRSLLRTQRFRRRSMAVRLCSPCSELGRRSCTSCRGQRQLPNLRPGRLRNRRPSFTFTCRLRCSLSSSPRHLSRPSHSHPFFITRRRFMCRTTRPPRRASSYGRRRTDAWLRCSS